ncbi:hypothetical protein [Streptomyces sp. BE133]|nr:hypothetical protein [Streptomyces sp. BE133]MEE1807233.1 hypothetical protein [Streptomyces sp. BE133]
MTEPPDSDPIRRLATRKVSATMSAASSAWSGRRMAKPRIGSTCSA